MTVSIDKTFRVQITERRSGRTYDLQVSGLHYELGLPGGFKTCEFTASAVESANMNYLDDVKVFYGDDIAWEGQVEEIDAAGFATTLTCLGYSATLKDQPLGVLFCDRAWDRWVDGDAVVPPGLTSHRNSYFSGSFSLDGTDGLCGQMTPSVATYKLNEVVEYKVLVYIPPWGSRVRSIGGQVRGSMNLPLGALSTIKLYFGNSGTDWNVPALFGVDTQVLNAQVAAPAQNQFDGVARPGRHDVSLGSGSNKNGHILLALDGVDWNLGNGYLANASSYARVFNISVTGELHPDTASYLREEDLTIDNMVRALINRIQTPTRISSSSEAMTPGRYVFQQATFDEKTPEQIIQALCDVVGWEWGVFENGRVYVGPVETVTALGYRDRSIFDAPPWYLSLRVEDGHNIDIKQSNAMVVNQVQTIGTGVNGLRSETVFSNFNDPRCPLNNPGSPPLEIRSRMLPVPNGFGVLDIAVLAAAHLNRYAAPLVTGQVTISLPCVQRVDMGTTTPFIIGVSEIGGPDTFGGRPMEFQTQVAAPTIRPGYWCHFPDLETTLDDPVTNADSGMTRRPAGGLAMIRYVTVDAGDGGATVVLTLDDGSTRFDTALAQFTESRSR